MNTQKTLFGISRRSIEEQLQLSQGYLVASAFSSFSNIFTELHIPLSLRMFSVLINHAVLMVPVDI